MSQKFYMQSTTEPYGHRNWWFIANTNIFFLRKGT